MESPAASLIAFAIAAVVIVLLLLLSGRAISWAKKRRGGAELLGGSLNVGSALNPAEAVVEEKRRVKRSESASEDPENPDA